MRARVSFTLSIQKRALSGVGSAEKDKKPKRIGNTLGR